ncbi:hypothetical protein [Metasolibacillus meyeri]|uniref:capsular polysaccharide export protein, LipB/KpsS family n=1 Tax=Metasolibacillus meyeri TaxID=1071052 RepID=UPI000D3214B2|nr:hypothetical protein [Metasolibacillus meyeri]
MLKKFEDNAKKVVNLILQTSQSRSETKLNNEGQVIGIVITAWLNTDVPFYSLILGQLLNEKKHKIVFIFDDFMFFGDRYQNEVLYEVYNKIEEPYKKMLLSNFTKFNISEHDISKYINFNEQLINRQYSNSEYQYAAGYLQKSYSAYSELFAKTPFDKVIVPGGVYKNTKIISDICESFDTEYITYDSGDSCLLLGINSIASHKKGVEEAYIKLKKYPNSEIFSKKIIEQAEELLKLRRKGNDVFGYQKENVYHMEIDKRNVLFPLNLFNDAAAVGINCGFLNIKEWLFETIYFLLHNTSYQIIIRDHPSSDQFYNNTNLIKEIEFNFAKFISNGRVLIFKHDKKINTYSILEKTDLVLPYTSTLGIEAGILGKKSILCTDVYYKNSNFVESTLDKREYLNKILYFSQECKMDVQDKNEALEYYYFSQVLGFLETQFTPQPSNFAYLLDNFKEVIRSENVEILLNAIENSESLEWLFLKNKLEQGVL